MVKASSGGNGLCSGGSGRRCRSGRGQQQCVLVVAVVNVVVVVVAAKAVSWSRHVMVSVFVWVQSSFLGRL
jgi:hypothetical protein